MLREVPRHCSLGAKTSSKGYQQYWRGYKLHVDAQVAIPLATLTASRVTSLYDLDTWPPPPGVRWW